MDWTCVSRASDSDSGVWIYIVYPLQNRQPGTCSPGEHSMVRIDSIEMRECFRGTRCCLVCFFFFFLFFVGCSSLTEETSLLMIK